MNLIVIANISNGKETIGFRLLDTDTKQIKDVPIDNIKNVISSGNVKIEGLGIQEGLVVGSNGSIERLPKIVSGEIVGKSPLVIINQIGTIGYTVSDYIGRIAIVKNEDVVKYAGLQGIANGKVVNKDNKEYISSINGNYKVVKLEDIVSKSGTNRNSNRTVKNKYYTGEEVASTKPLLPIKVEDKVVRIKDGKTVIEDFRDVVKNYESYSSISRNQIKNNMVYETDTFTLLGKQFNYLDVSNKKQLSDILNLIKNEDFRDNIDSTIVSFNNSHYGKEVTRDKKTGLIIPGPFDNYIMEAVEVYLDDSKNDYKSIEQSEEEEYFEKLKVMKCNSPIIEVLLTEHKEAVLSRRCTSRGIDYKILTIGEYRKCTIKTETLEDIYAKRDRYPNVEEINGEFVIRGLDGTYRYNMEMIHETYGRGVAHSVRNVKASLVDPKYNEIITVRGELKELKAGARVVIVPSNVTEVLKGSIILNRENTAIAFGENIKKYHPLSIISNKEWQNKALSNIEINSDKYVGMNIIKSLHEVGALSGATTEIKYSRDIEPEEYGELRYIGIPKGSITINNEITDELVLKAVESIIENRLDNCLILEKPIEFRAVYLKSGKFEKLQVNAAFKKFKSEFKSFQSFWENKLSKEVSESLRGILEARVAMLTHKMEERLQELDEDRKYTLSTIQRQL